MRTVKEGFTPVKKKLVCRGRSTGKRTVLEFIIAHPGTDELDIARGCSIHLREAVKLSKELMAKQCIESSKRGGR